MGQDRGSGLLRADMQRIQFRIENQLLPKKDGATSMWGQPPEAGRLITLRRKVLEVFRISTALHSGHSTFHSLSCRPPER